MFDIIEKLIMRFMWKRRLFWNKGKIGSAIFNLTICLHLRWLTKHLSIVVDLKQGQVQDTWMLVSSEIVETKYKKTEIMSLL